MVFPDPSGPPRWPNLGWVTAIIAGVAAPVITLAMLAQSSADAAQGAAQIAVQGGAIAPILSLGMMGIGMIAAAVSARLWVGTLLAGTNAVLLTLLAFGFGLIAQVFSGPITLTILMAVLVAVLAACISFAARGALFARSASPLGWLVALGVVAGEGAILITALVEPDALPAWLLALLPAQWANLALQAAFGGTVTAQGFAAIAALLGTAAATMFVTYLWPRRWTYSIMFTVWLAASALVWSQTGPN